ncbi:MAG TPA: hypothetical protein VH478_16700 [Trebonia sp.]|jgi:hypothetical protein|nr:hypothetical protein [Trebonia sp.]
MKLRFRARQDPPADVPVAGESLLPPEPADAAGILAAAAPAVPVPADLQLPAPARLALTAGWNLAESLALPVVGYLIGERFGGQGIGMAAATAMVWLTAVARKVFTGTVPGLLVISGLVLTLQAVLVLATGSVLLFLLQFPVANLALCILFARTAPTSRPLIAQLAAEVVALRQPGTAHPGLQRFFRGVTWLWAGIFAASTVGLAILLVFEPTAVFLLLTTVVTVAGTAAGILLSVVWFMRMLRRSGLRVRFGHA